MSEKKSDREPEREEEREEDKGKAYEHVDLLHEFHEEREESKKKGEPVEEHKFTPEEEKEIMRNYMISIGRSFDKKHMSEIGRKGRATLVKNILEQAKKDLEKEARERKKEEV